MVMTKTHETHPGRNTMETAVRMMNPASVKLFFNMLVNVRNAKKTGLARGKQYLLGRKLKFGKHSTWTGATLRINVKP